MKQNIFIADDIHPAGINLLKKKFRVINLAGLSNHSLLKKLITFRHVKSALIIRSVRRLDAWFIKKLAEADAVKLICTVSTGFDNVDIKVAKKYGINVINVYGGNTIAAAEHTFAMILAVVKNITAKNYEMSKGKFASGYFNSELYGKTIGIIGVGRIGSRVAKTARQFGMTVVGNDIKPSLQNKYRWIKFTSLNNLLKSSDIISVHTPLDSSTYHLLNSANMKLIQKHAIIINCARGGIIDETVLYKMLASKRIMAAGLDVFKNEPKFDKKFSRLDNSLLTPHTAGKTLESREAMAVIAAKDIIKKLGK